MPAAPLSKHDLALLKAFGNRLKASRIAAGYEDARAFAADVGVKDGTYRKYERGEAFPVISTLEICAKLTGKTLDFLILGIAPDRKTSR